MKQKEKYILENPDRYIEEDLRKIEDQNLAPGIPVGSAAPPFCLEDVNGQEVCLSDFLKKGPVIISFVRGDWCRYCRNEMESLHRELSEIYKFEGSLIVISPQIAESGRNFIKIKQYDFPLLIDADQKIMKLYRVQFDVPQKMKIIYRDVYHHDLEDLNENHSWTLPVPATFILDHRGVIVSRFVSPDYTKRMPPEKILSTLKNLSNKNSDTLHELKSRNEILQSKIEEIQNLQEKLIRQEKRALVGDMTTGILHEIKNLLNPISSLDFIKKDISPENLIWVQMIYDARDRSIALIDEIRLMTKNEESHYILSELQINELLQESIQIAKLDRDINSIEIITEFKGIFNIKGNRNKLIQVMLNLIRNASHAVAQKKQGEVRIILEKQNDEISIHVRDNGHGMEAETLKKIWDPFFTTRGEQGTGIGLGICRNIIEYHGGKMICESRPGEGSTFSFTLPSE